MDSTTGGVTFVESAFGNNKRIASGDAKVEIIKKNINRKNRISARAPVSTSDASRSRFLKFIG
jgi:hypothetical protein